MRPTPAPSAASTTVVWRRPRSGCSLLGPQKERLYYRERPLHRLEIVIAGDCDTLGARQVGDGGAGRDEQALPHSPPARRSATRRPTSPQASEFATSPLALSSAPMG